MKRMPLMLTILLFSFVALSLAQTAEKRSDSGFFVLSVRMEPAAPVIGSNSARVAVRDARTGAAVEGAALEVTPWMTMHGHGSTKKTQVKELGSGLYAVDDITFTMEGDWDLLITIEKGGVKDTASVAIRNVR